MDPDALKEVWKTQSSQSCLTGDADQLLKDLERQAACFTAGIFWRDVREVGVALVLVPLWYFIGVKLSLPWTWYSVIPAMLWVATYMLADRKRHNRRPPEPGEPLRRHAESLLGRRLSIKSRCFVTCSGGISCRLRFRRSRSSAKSPVRNGRVAGSRLLGASMVVAIIVAAFAFIYWLNQCAVRAGLEPKRRELEALVLSLKDETSAASG